MKITVFGSGYVGLVTSACFAEAGNKVVCVDVDSHRVELLKSGHVPIFEPGLEELLHRNLNEGRLHFTTDAANGVEHGDFQFIAVGTPSDEDGSADLKYVLQVAETIGKFLKKEAVVINKSTVPVGTADKVSDKIEAVLAKRSVNLSFSVVSNPEFLKEGAAINDFMRPDRVVIGASSNETAAKMKQLYSAFNRNHEKIIVMDVRSAELTKYAANAMLATKISFINEIAQLAERLDADIESVRQGIGADERIGYHFIYPGCGYGGSCFPKDVKALIRTASDVDFLPHVLNAVESVNADQKQLLFNRVKAYFGDSLQGKKIAVWGLAFKPNTDDMREAPSRELLENLWQHGASVSAFDPEAMKEARRLYPDQTLLTLSPSEYDALDRADALVICTDWRQFKNPDFNEIKNRLNSPVIFDGRNLYEPALMRKEGFAYFAIGRGERLTNNTSMVQ
ncbi:nucleotide sugar dehydrogenase [Halomonas alkaliantarctica]|nr:nucleotide sugar dehydrogenase [Halomonas alkaliantarctica]